MYVLEEKNRPVLLLNAAFLPSEWVNQETAVKHYAEERVIGEVGEHSFVFKGGFGRNGVRSVIEVSSIIAISGKVVVFDNKARFGLPKRGNHMLFMRDRHLCAYCGDHFASSALTREHVRPRNGVHGGTDA